MEPPSKVARAASSFVDVDLLNKVKQDCKDLLLLCNSLPELDKNGQVVVPRSVLLTRAVKTRFFFPLGFLWTQRQGVGLKKRGDEKKGADNKKKKKSGETEQPPDWKGAMLDFVYSSLQFYHAAEAKQEEGNAVGARLLLRETAAFLMGLEIFCFFFVFIPFK
jgi:hypothetical protein